MPDRITKIAANILDMTWAETEALAKSIEANGLLAKNGYRVAEVLQRWAQATMDATPTDDEHDDPGTSAAGRLPHPGEIASGEAF